LFDSTSEDNDNHVVRLSISSAQRLSPQLVKRVEQACNEVDDLPRSVVLLRLTDEPVDEGAEAAELTVHLVNQWERALRRLERIDAVTIAVASGWCGGPALEALLSTDYRIASADVRLRLPSAAGEPWPGMAVHRLANQVGVARARPLVLFGTELSAAQALQLGLVDEIATDVTAAAEARRAAVRSLTGSEVAIRRRLLMEAPAISFEDALGTHLAACDRTLRRMKAGALT